MTTKEKRQLRKDFIQGLMDKFNCSSPKDFAELVHCNPTDVEKWMKGESLPSRNDIHRMYVYVNADVLYMYSLFSDE